MASICREDKNVLSRGCGNTFLRLLKGVALLKPILQSELCMVTTTSSSFFRLAALELAAKPSVGMFHETCALKGET